MDDTVQIRMAKFQEELAGLIRKYDIEPIPTLFHGTSAIIANITLIDLKDPAMLRKYGRMVVPPADGGKEKEEDEAPINPRIN